MTDQNERPEEAQEEAGSAQGERKVEATDAARRKAEDLEVDLTAVNGTGANNRITVDDVEDAYEQAQRTTKLAESIQGASTRLTEDPQRMQTTSTDGTALTPKEQGIVAQYNVLKAILADPETKVPPSPPNFPYDDPARDFVPHPPLAEWYFPYAYGYGYYLAARVGDGSSPDGPERPEGAPEPEQSTFAEQKEEE